MNNLQPLYDAFIGQSQAPQASSTTGPSWQELLKTQLDPAYQKKQALKKALLAASSALLNTKGDFMGGLAQAANQGASTYNDARDRSQSQQIEAMQLLEKSEQEKREQSLSRLRDAIGIGQSVNSSIRAAENDKWTRDRQTKQDMLASQRETRMQQQGERRLQIAQQRASADAERIDAKNGVRSADTLTQWQQSKVKMDINDAVQKFSESLGDAGSDPDRMAARDAEIQTYRDNLMKLHNFDPETGQYAGPQGVGPVEPTPETQGLDPSQAETTKTVNGKTYYKINGQWYEE